MHSRQKDIISLNYDKKYFRMAKFEIAEVTEMLPIPRIG